MKNILDNAKLVITVVLAIILVFMGIGVSFGIMYQAMHFIISL